MQRLPAEMRLRKNEQLLRKSILRIPCCKNGIGKEVVHRFQSGRGKIANPRDLHRCGTIGENRQRTARRVPCEINKDVDAVTIDLMRGFLWRKAGKAAKMIDGLLHPLGIFVLCIQCIDRHRKACGIERRHQSIRKGEHNVLPDIG